MCTRRERECVFAIHVTSGFCVHLCMTVAIVLCSVLLLGHLVNYVRHRITYVDVLNKCVVYTCRLF